MEGIGKFTEIGEFLIMDTRLSFPAPQLESLHEYEATTGSDVQRYLSGYVWEWNRFSTYMKLPVGGLFENLIKTVSTRLLDKQDQE